MKNCSKIRGKKEESKRQQIRDSRYTYKPIVWISVTFWLMIGPVYLYTNISNPANLRGNLVASQNASPPMLIFQSIDKEPRCETKQKHLVIGKKERDYILMWKIVILHISFYIQEFAATTYKTTHIDLICKSQHLAAPFWGPFIF